jgi:L-threonylcarbamoyladenylate synthase
MFHSERQMVYRTRAMPSASEISMAADALQQGELVAFPTETVYGLGADATNDAAVARLFAVKKRPIFNPLICHVADAADAFKLGDFPDAARALAERFWPGPLTIVVPRAARSRVSLLASAGLESLALRVPRHPIARQLLQAFDQPLVAPSANPSGGLSPTTAEHVRQGLGIRVKIILDGGPAIVGLESTVVSFLEDEVRLLRPGGLAREEVERILGYKITSGENSVRPHAPGQLESHYAPRACLRLGALNPGEEEVYLGFGAYDHGPFNLSRAGDVDEAAANLFRMLHELDHSGAAKIAVAPIPEAGLGVAINDRLRRAAAPRPAQ